MKDAFGQPLNVTDTVVLLSKPDGYVSGHLPLTVGARYKVLGFMESNVVTTTDEPGLTGSYWRGRVQKADHA